jgi:hypothetical protein
MWKQSSLWAGITRFCLGIRGGPIALGSATIMEGLFPLGKRPMNVCYPDNNASGTEDERETAMRYLRGFGSGCGSFAETGQQASIPGSVQRIRYAHSERTPPRQCDYALRSCLGSAMAPRALRHPDRALAQLITLLLRHGGLISAASCERSLPKRYRPFDSAT